MTRTRSRYLVLSPDALATREAERSEASDMRARGSAGDRHASRGAGWASVLADTLSRHAADVTASAADLRPHVSGFPWERPSEMHADWPGDRWWRQHEPVFAAAFAGVGVPRRRADALAEEVQAVYRDTERWEVHPEAEATLDAARAKGWQPVLLANGPPELPELLDELGLTFAETFVSALTGYELPHPRAWETVYDWAGDARFWAAGTDVDRDCEAAWDAGVPAVQVTDAPAGIAGEWDRTATLAQVPALLPE